jgi:hypothetical protein
MIDQRPKGLIASHHTSILFILIALINQKSFSLRVVVVVHRRFGSDPPRIGIEGGIGREDLVL